MVFIPSRIYYEVATTYQVPGISTTYTITITTYHIPLELTTGPDPKIRLKVCKNNEFYIDIFY